MLLTLPEVLTKEQVARVRSLLDGAEWTDGRVTAGHQSARVKSNRQVSENHPAAKEAGGMILEALGRNNLFLSAALPNKVYPPLFNRYEGGEFYGTHVDGAIRQAAGNPNRLRTDLSATLFLTEPGEYEGGDLTVEDTYGLHQVKLPAGHMILYPASSLHHVKPVTKGVRTASFFWIQSMVREDGQRTLLYDLDTATQRLSRDQPDHPSTTQLAGVYNNLLRLWAEV
jgi:PKHD-type hydroxylase